MKRIPVYYTPEMAVSTPSISPSSAKPRAVVDDWLAAGLPIKVIKPTPWLPVNAHDPDYISAVMAGEADNGFGNRDPAVAESLRWTNGAVFSATKAMMETRGPAVAVAPASGFHHAHYDRPRGFCTFNGLVGAAMLAAAAVKRSAIIDCDFHYGDGTDAILAEREHRCGGQVKHWSAGQVYTDRKQAKTFLNRLPEIIAELTHLCPIVFYQAGADPHIHDPLGGFLTTDELLERDRIVFWELARRRKRVIWTLAGGYQAMPKLLTIHRNTMQACIEQFVDVEVSP